MRTFSKNLLCFYIVVMLFCSVCAGALPDTGRLVPTETLAVVNINNFSTAKGNFEKTNIYKLYQDPSMKTFIEDAKEKLRQNIREKNSKILQAVMNSEVMPEGRVFLALIWSEKAQKEREPQALFLIQFGSGTGQARELVADIVREAVDEGARERQQEYRDVTIKTVIKDKGRFDYGFSSEISYCFIDDFLVVSEDAEVLRFCIAHLDGSGGSTLANDRNYSDALGALGSDHDIMFYINLKHIIQTQTAEDETGETRTAIENFGLDNAACVCGFVDMASRQKLSWFGRVLMMVNGEKKGILKMLEPVNATFQAPRFIPPTMNSLSFLNINVQRAYQELANIVTMFSPMQASLLYAPIVQPGPEGEPGFELKKDFIDHLGSQIVYSSGINADKSVAENTESLLAVRVLNPQALEKSLSSLHWRFIGTNKPDSRREIQGYTMYRLGYFFFPMPIPEQQTLQSPVEVPPPPFPRLAFAVTNTHLLFGPEDVIERALRILSASEDSSVATARWYRAAKSELPTEAGFAGMEDTSSAGEMLWKSLKQIKEPSDGESNVEIGVGIDSAVSPFPGVIFSQRLFDTSLLPEFDAIQKYFGLYVNYLVSRPDGFLFEFKSIDTTEEN